MISQIPQPARLWILALATTLLLSPAVGASTGESRRWTPDDVVLEERATDWTLSPDGRLAAWIRSTVERVEGEEKRISNLWLASVAEGQSRPLTRGKDSVSRPAFSPDGRRLAFLTNRSLPEKKGNGEVGKTQVWIIPVDGGEPYPVTAFDRDVKDFAWRDGETLVVLAAESRSLWEQEKKEQKDTSIVVEDAEHEPPVRLFQVGAEPGGKVRRLTVNQDWMESLAVSPDGQHAVVTAQQSLSFQFDQRVPPKTYLVDLKTGDLTELFAGENLLPFSIRWKLDSSGFYFANEFTRHPIYRMATITELHHYDLARGTQEKVDLQWPWALGGGYAPTADGFIALLADGVRFRPARYLAQGKGFRKVELQGTHVRNIDRWTASSDGRTVVYQHSSATLPPQLYATRLEGGRLLGEQKLTELNSRYQEKPTGRVEILQWPGARDEIVEGILLYPLDWEEGKKYPLILDIHGGPASADRDTWSQSWATPTILWRQRGAFVLQVNYHGSSNYGLDWVESIGEGKYYELEIPDIEAGVDHVIGLGLVDPERLASAGWSNGGILTAELITRTQRYRAASVGAADVEWISDWANVDFGAAFDNYYLGAPPWEAVEVYIEKSPFFRLTQVTTPTIVYTGTEDRNVPPHQSWSLFRALQQIGKAPTRLLLFPGEPHGLRKIAHQRRKIDEDLAWFDRYLFEQQPEANEALKSGSPLEGLLQRQRAARVGRSFGVEVEGVLAPETVPFQGFQVGRFEVTRAQFAAFDPGFGVESGEENLPATGISFEEARAYVEWLGRITGRPYRLPTEEEARRLAESAGTSGNTLNRWAGYSPNPEDTARLAKALDDLPSPAPLLLPVGSLPGTGEDPVFDLDGNAAEWTVAEGGRGVAVGPSADQATDPRRRGGTDDPQYIGFRVLLDPSN